MATSPKYAAIRAIEYYLPATRLSSADLLAEFPDWPIEKIDQTTGIGVRHIAAPGECASDMAVMASRKLFDSGACGPADVDYILFCTQSPDYFLPTTACLIQEKLGVPTAAGALDFNLGSSGFVYGLGLAKGLIETQQADNVLLLTAETYTKYLHREDRSVRTIFGDGAAATFVSGASEPSIGPFVFGTDGRGAGNLIVPTGGMRCARSAESGVAETDESGNVRSRDNLFMDGGEIFTFALKAVPGTVSSLLARAGKAKEDIDLFVFHQANQYILDYLRKRMKVPEEKFYIFLRDCGNTASSSIPIALKAAATEGRLKPGSLVMLVGFGPGYSWGGSLLRWCA